MKVNVTGMIQVHTFYPHVVLFSCRSVLRMHAIHSKHIETSLLHTGLIVLKINLLQNRLNF